MKSLARITAAATLAALTAPVNTFACATCFGAAGSGQVEGMNGAIIGLLVVTVGMMGAFGSFFMFLRKRARIGAKPAVNPGHIPPDRTANQEEVS